MKSNKENLKQKVKSFNHSINDILEWNIPYPDENKFNLKSKESLTTFYSLPSFKDYVLFTASLENLKKLSKEYNDDIFDKNNIIDLQLYEINLIDYKEFVEDQSDCFFNPEKPQLCSLFDDRFVKKLTKKKLPHTEINIDLVKYGIDPLIIFNRKEPILVSNIKRFKLDNTKYEYFQIDRVNLYFIQSNQTYFIDFFFDVVEMLKYKQNLEAKKKIKNEKI